MKYDRYPYCYGKTVTIGDLMIAQMRVAQYNGKYIIEQILGITYDSMLAKPEPVFGNYYVSVIKPWNTGTRRKITLIGGPHHLEEYEEWDTHFIQFKDGSRYDRDGYHDN